MYYFNYFGQYFTCEIELFSRVYTLVFKVCLLNYFMLSVFFSLTSRNGNRAYECVLIILSTSFN